MDFVQTHPRVLIAASTVMNTVDPRNWVFTIALFFLDLAVNISSIYYAWKDWIPVGCMLAGIGLMACEVPFIGFYFKYALERKKQLRAAFVQMDTDKDGFLSRGEVEEVMSILPKDTFDGEFSTKLDKYSIDHLLWCQYQPRMFFFRTLEFCVAWLMFFASLMLFTPQQPITTIVAVQGVVSVIGIMLVLNDVFENYFRKYHAKWTWLKYFCMLSYGATLLTVFAVLLAGYGFVSLIYEGRYSFPPVSVNATYVPQDDIVGFVTGWLLTCFLVAAFTILACGNFLCAKTGLLEVRVHHVGIDDPVKLLRKTAVGTITQRKSREMTGSRTSASMQAGSRISGPPASMNFPNGELPPPPPAIGVTNNNSPQSGSDVENQIITV